MAETATPEYMKVKKSNIQRRCLTGDQSMKLFLNNPRAKQIVASIKVGIAIFLCDPLLNSPNNFSGSVTNTVGPTKAVTTDKIAVMKPGIRDIF